MTNGATSMSDEHALAVLLPEGADGCVLRYEIVRPRVACDGRVYTRRSAQPAKRGAPKWYIYSERPVDESAIARAAALLRDFVARERGPV